MSLRSVDFADRGFDAARIIQNKHNHGQLVDKEEIHIGEVMNLLEKYMRGVKQTFLTRYEVENILKTDAFHNFVVKEMEGVYEKTVEELGHLLSNPQYHSVHGSRDIKNPYNHLDEELKQGGSLPDDL